MVQKSQGQPPFGHKHPVNNGISLPYQLVSLPDFLKHQPKPPKNCWLEDYYQKASFLGVMFHLFSGERTAWLRGTWENPPKVPVGVSPSVWIGWNPTCGFFMVERNTPGSSNIAGCKIHHEKRCISYSRWGFSSQLCLFTGG